MPSENEMASLNVGVQGGLIGNCPVWDGTSGGFCSHPVHREN